MSNGDTIQGRWENDKMNGEGKIIRSNGKTVDCIFYNDSKVELEE